MNTLLVILRAVHYTTAMLLFGEILFALLVARPLFSVARANDIQANHARDACLLADWAQRRSKVARICLLASLLSGAGWFAVAAIGMSGLPLSQALAAKTVGLILGKTVFGQVFAVRAGLLIALAALLLILSRSPEGARRFRFELATLGLAAAYLASLVGAGHAVAGDEAGNVTRIGSDIAHLLAAGGWLGALPALVFVLGHRGALDIAAGVARRFSVLGLTSVAVLTVSGIANSWYQVGGFPALLGTPYGRLLLAKLVLFALMLGIASANRGLSMRLDGVDKQSALQRLRRNAIAEIVVGTGVIALVAALGVVVPALHDAIVWPFAHTLSFDRLSQSAWMQLGVVAAGTVACIAALALLAGVLARPQKLRGFAAAGLVGALAIYVWLLLVPAHSTTYLVSPVPYAAEAIAAGSRLYMENCSSCHGFDGRGNVEEIASPANATVNIDVNLNDITRRRRAGDLFWSIAHGIPSTAMPGFKEQLAEPDIWNLIQYLDAQTAAHNALSLSDRLKPVLPVPAPEFTFEFPHKFTEENPNEYPGGQQESLWQQRGTRIPLLVFYTLPSSLPRLRELAALANGYAQAGAMVIAIPMSASGASPGAAAPPDLPGTGVPIFAATRPSVATTYALFARQKQDARPETVRHVEYLVDRFGSLRARWIGVPAATSAWSVNMLRQIDVLAHEPPRPPVQWGHRH